MPLSVICLHVYAVFSFWNTLTIFSVLGTLTHPPGPVSSLINTEKCFPSRVSLPSFPQCPHATLNQHRSHKIISNICLLQAIKLWGTRFYHYIHFALSTNIDVWKIFIKLTEYIVCSKREQETYQNKNGEINWLETTLHCDKVELESFI